MILVLGLTVVLRNIENRNEETRGEPMNKKKKKIEHWRKNMYRSLCHLRAKRWESVISCWLERSSGPFYRIKRLKLEVDLVNWIN